jgi:hypothetical protein
MKLFRTKVWWWFDIGLVKWSAILIGMVAGAFLADFVMQYVWVFIFAAIAFAIRPTFKYFDDKE